MNFQNYFNHMYFFIFLQQAFIKKISLEYIIRIFECNVIDTVLCLAS